jgi:hypothetical protein
MRAHTGGAVILLAFATVEACSGTTTTPGAATWFDPCSTAEECGSGTCVCGRCTVSCTSDAPCEKATPGATCVALSATATCENHPAPAGVSGICAGRQVTPDASVPLPLLDASRPDPSQFAAVNVPVDFTEPVSLPLPDPTFSGDASSLVGSWVELAFDGQPCTPQNSGPDLAGSVCTHLDIVAVRGGYSGTFYREVSQQNEPPVTGPFAPMTDPGQGYPVELRPDQYGAARDFVPGVRYRVFDGLVRSGELTFWISPLDVWTDWCNKQTPSRWDIRGRHEYRCVPQTASQADTDLAKLALCTSAEDLPYCADSSGVSQPCVCLDDTSQFNGALPLCSLTYCECSLTECHADMRGTSITSNLKIEGDTLIGAVTFDTLFGAGNAITLKKVSP